MPFLAQTQWHQTGGDSSFALLKIKMMQTKQTIAIIGATGNMGGAISKSLSKGNYRLLLKGNEQEKLDTLVKEIKRKNATADVEASACPTEAGWEADIIILAVPYQAEKEIVSN